MKLNLVIMLFISLYYGCAKPAKTVAKFNLRSLSNLGADVVDIGENGVVIFGRNDKGHRFAKVMNSGDDFDYELDNGLWTFKAIAWDAGNPTATPVNDTPTENFTGHPSCGSAVVPLNGNEINISLSLKNADCANADFSSGGKSYLNGAFQNFYPLNDIYSCDSSVGDGSTVSWGDECINDFAGYATNSGDDSYLNRGYHSAYKIIVRSFYAGPSSAVVGTTELATACLTANDLAGTGDAGLAAALALQIPSGSGMSFAVKAYYDDACSGRFNEYLLSAGLGNDGGNIGIAFDGTAQAQKLYLKSSKIEVCQGAGLTGVNAGGNGSNGKPFLICTANQLNEIYGQAATEYAKNYRLVRDIDMNNSNYHQANSSLIAAGKNFKPLGFRETDAASPGGTCGTAATNAAQFSGDFDGGGNTIKNLKMEAFKAFDGSFCDNTGLFGYTNGANFARLKIEGAEIHNGLTFTGLIAGNAFNTNAYGIDIKDSTVHSDNQAGTVAPVFGDLLGTSSYKAIILNNVVVDNTATQVATLPTTISGRCEGTGVISVNGAGITSGPYTNVCSGGVVGSFNITGVSFTPGNGVKDFTITHANGNTVLGKYDYAAPVTPTVTDVSSTSADGNYVTAANIYIDVTFSVDITVTGTPQLALNAGGPALYDSAPASNVARFLFTVAGPHTTSDLDYSSTTALTLSGGTIVATTGGTAADLTLAAPGSVGSISDDQAITVNYTPTANITNITSSLADGTYGPGQIIDIDVTFDTVVTSSTSSLTLDNGVNATLQSGSGTTTLTYRYTVGATGSAQDSADLTVATFNVGDSGASATIPAGGASNDNLGVNKNIVIDTTAPTITQITSSKPDGAWPVSTVIQVTVTFSENVAGASGTSVTLDTGGSAAFVSGGGTTFHVFNYTVAAAENSSDLTATAYVPMSAADAAGNAVDTTLPVGNNIADLKAIVIDTTAPTVSINTPSHINASNDTSYTLTGTCSENGELVNVDIGGLVPTAPTCTGGFWTISGFDVSSLAESGDPTIADVVISITQDDTASNQGSVSATVIKDTMVPTVTNISDATAGTPYQGSGTMTINITFSEQVDLQGTATLDLNLLYGSNQAISTTSGLGLNHSFDFNYGQHNASLDLQYSSTSALTAGVSIKDPAGNDANLALFNPGDPGSLSANSGPIVVQGGLGFDLQIQTTTPSENFTLPLRSSYNYNFVIDWGDGNFDHIISDSDPNATHTYLSAGTYEISIRGYLEAWYFNNTAHATKILRVYGIGDVGWINFENAFYGCSNIVEFNTGGGGETINVTNMAGMFRASSADPVMTGWDVSSVTDMSYMFEGNTGATTTDLSSWNTSSVQNMSFMFANSVITPIMATNFVTASVTDISSMFENNTAIYPSTSGWDTSSVTNMNRTFYGASTALPQFTAGWDFSNVTDLTDFLTNSGINNAEYTNFLIQAESTANSTNLNSITVYSGPAQYQAAGTTARTNLVSTPFFWTLTDGGLQP